MESAEASNQTDCNRCEQHYTDREPRTPSVGKRSGQSDGATGVRVRQSRPAAPIGPIREQSHLCFRQWERRQTDGRHRIRAPVMDFERRHQMAAHKASEGGSENMPDLGLSGDKSIESGWTKLGWDDVSSHSTANDSERDLSIRASGVHVSSALTGSHLEVLTGVAYNVHAGTGEHARAPVNGHARELIDTESQISSHPTTTHSLSPSDQPGSSFNDSSSSLDVSVSSLSAKGSSREYYGYPLANGESRPAPSNLNGSGSGQFGSFTGIASHAAKETSMPHHPPPKTAPTDDQRPQEHPERDHKVNHLEAPKDAAKSGDLPNITPSTVPTQAQPSSTIDKTLPSSTPPPKKSSNLEHLKEHVEKDHAMLPSDLAKPDFTLSSANKIQHHTPVKETRGTSPTRKDHADPKETNAKDTFPKTLPDKRMSDDEAASNFYSRMMPIKDFTQHRLPPLTLPENSDPKVEEPLQTPPTNVKTKETIPTVPREAKPPASSPVTKATAAARQATPVKKTVTTDKGAKPRSSGRLRRTVDRLSIGGTQPVSSNVSRQKAVNLMNGVGKGLAFGDIEHISSQLQKRKSDYEPLIALHRLIYGSPGVAQRRRANLRLFNGFSSADNRDKVTERLVSGSYTMAGVRQIAAFLNLETEGTKEALAKRIAAFLLKPEDLGDSKPTVTASSATKTTKKSPNKRAPAARKSPVAKKPKTRVKSGEADEVAIDVNQLEDDV